VIERCCERSRVLPGLRFRVLAAAIALYLAIFPPVLFAKAEAVSGTVPDEERQKNFVLGFANIVKQFIQS